MSAAASILVPKHESEFDSFVAKSPALCVAFFFAEFHPASCTGGQMDQVSQLAICLFLMPIHGDCDLPFMISIYIYLCYE